MAILDLTTGVLLAASIVLLVPSALFLVQVLASFLPATPPPGAADARPDVAILVPAHDEALMIAETIGGIQKELLPGDRLVVVADNCTDATADIASSLGAEVVERRDLTRRGKSYALAFGVRYLSETPPAVLIVLDADCRFDPGSIATIATRAHSTGRPAQAAYEMQIPYGVNSPNLRLAEFAFKVKNVVRPLGFAKIGLPCQLMGTGMAFPWTALQKADLDSGELAEDLVLGLDLARAHYPPEFCPSARVTSEYPLSEEGRKSQRARWEAGHLRAIWSRVPGLALEALRTGNPALFAQVLDAAVPPIALHTLALSAFLAFAGLYAFLTGAVAPFIVGALSLVCLLAAVGLAWRRVGKDKLKLRELVSVPAYMFGKIPLYSSVFKGKSVFWVRSKRD